jgi:hypothetical protein
LAASSSGAVLNFFYFELSPQRSESCNGTAIWRFRAYWPLLTAWLLIES